MNDFEFFAEIVSDFDNNDAEAIGKGADAMGELELNALIAAARAFLVWSAIRTMRLARDEQRRTRSRA
jgi:hypothetical protein